jgi:hypothetical protein
VRRLGRIVRIQVQRDPIKLKGQGYFPEPLLAGDEAAIGPQGIVLRHADGWVIDTHHGAHPHGKGGGRRALSIGFTSHYEAMASRFGSAPVGIAGENLIVEADGIVTEPDLARGVVVHTPDGAVPLTGARAAAPCKEFCTFMLGEGGVLPLEEIGGHMDFLADGMRGFILDVAHLDRHHTVRVGDEVFVRPT